jgi:hypothetical protein
MAKTQSQFAGVIDPAFLYRFDEAAKRMGWGRPAADAAKRRGLKTMKSGKRLYVLGREILEFIQRDSEARAGQ